MDLKDIMAISGMPGLYRVAATRTDGIIAEGLHDKVKKFVSSRQHMFTPLENITIYTVEDSIELKYVFSNMKKNAGTTSVPDVKKADDATLRKYMKSILENYDEEKVYASDIKKLIKWYLLLDQHNIISIISEDAEVASTEEAAEVETPKKKATKKKESEDSNVEEATDEAPKKKKSTKKSDM